MSDVECRMSNGAWRIANGECRMSTIAYGLKTLAENTDNTDFLESIVVIWKICSIFQYFLEHLRTFVKNPIISNLSRSAKIADLAKIGVDTAENEPLEVHLIIKPWDLNFTEPPRPPRPAGMRHAVQRSFRSRKNPGASS